MFLLVCDVLTHAYLFGIYIHVHLGEIYLAVIAHCHNLYKLHKFVMAANGTEIDSSFNKNNCFQVSMAK